MAKKTRNLKARPTGGSRLVRLKAEAGPNPGYLQSIVQPFGICQPATSRETAPVYELSGAYEMLAAHTRNGNHCKVWLEEIGDEEYAERWFGK